jgi:hypothetical protein
MMTSMTLGHNRIGKQGMAQDFYSILMRLYEF